MLARSMPATRLCSAADVHDTANVTSTAAARSWRLCALAGATCVTFSTVTSDGRRLATLDTAPAKTAAEKEAADTPLSATFATTEQQFGFIRRLTRSGATLFADRFTFDAEEEL
jgi:hypothetical protein